MLARALLFVVVASLVGLAIAAPSVAARPPVVGDCVVGNDQADCLVSVHWVVCVTEPCDPMKVCLLYGFICV